MLFLWCLAPFLIDPAEDLSAAGAEAVSVFDNPLASQAQWRGSRLIFSVGVRPRRETKQ
jgi:hypothetical protein